MSSQPEEKKKPYICEYCGYASRDKYNMNIHINRKFPCNYVNKTVISNKEGKPKLIQSKVPIPYKPRKEKVLIFKPPPFISAEELYPSVEPDSPIIDCENED